MIGEYVGAILARRNHVCHSQTERVDSPVGHFYRPYDVGIDRRFKPYRLTRVDRLGIYTRLMAALYEIMLIVKVIFGKRDKQAASVIDTVTRYTPEYHILFYTLRRRFLVGHGISCAAVEKPVVTPGSSGGKVKTLYQKSLQSTHGTVTRSAGTGGASTDYDYIVVPITFLAHGHFSLLVYVL